MANLIEGIQEQCARCRELIAVYDSIGPAGTFGKAMISASISEGEAAIASGDVMRMLAALKDLRVCE